MFSTISDISSLLDVQIKVIVLLWCLCLRVDGRSLAGHSDTLPDLHNEGVPPASQQTGAHRVIKCMLKGCIVFIHPFSQTQLALEADDVVFMACRKE